MDFILAHSRYTRHKFAQSIQICDKLLQKNNQDQAAWVLKCQCLIKENFIDTLQTEQDGLAQQLLEDHETNQLARVGTSFKVGTSLNPIMRPMNSGRVNTGFQRIGTSAAGSRAGTRSGGNMLRTGRIMTRAGVPTTSNGRILRLSTASLQVHGQNFFDSSKVDLKKIAKRKSKARLVFQYLFYVEHNLKKALQLAIASTQMNNFQDPWWKLALGMCYYHLSYYQQAQKQFLSSIKHNNNINSFLYLSRIYQKQDNPQKSLSILRKCINLNPFEPVCNIYVARIYNQLQNSQQSSQQYKKVLALQNCNIEAVASFASNLYYKDQAQVAVKMYQRLLQLGYDSAQVWNNLALCCMANNKWEIFFTCFQRAINLSKDQPLLSSDVWYNVAYAYVLIGQFQLAVEAYKISLTFCPENIQSLNNIGVIQSKNNVQTGIHWCQKSFKQFANFEAAFNLSIWYFQTNNFEKSYIYNQQTLKIYPQHSESMQLYTQLLIKLDRL